MVYTYITLQTFLEGLKSFSLIHTHRQHPLTTSEVQCFSQRHFNIQAGKAGIKPAIGLSEVDRPTSTPQLTQRLNKCY